jgi:hypothetical protein
MGFFSNLALRSVPASFESDRTIADCVERLTFRIDEFAVANTPAQHQRRVTGLIDGNRVRLHVITPFSGNIFARTFYGRFDRQDGKTVLIGRFSVDPWVETCVRAWLFLVGFAGFIFIADLAIGTQKLAARAGVLVVYAAVLLLYAFLMNYSNKWAKVDIKLIADEIRAALQ